MSIPVSLQTHQCLVVLLDIIFLLLNFENSFYILDTNPLSKNMICKDFLPTVAYISILVTISLAEERILILTISNLSYISSMDHAFGIISKNSFPSQGHNFF